MNMLTGVTTGGLYLVLCFDPGVLGQYYLPTTTTTTPWCLGPAGYADAPADQWTDPAESGGGSRLYGARCRRRCQWRLRGVITAT